VGAKVETIHSQISVAVAAGKPKGRWRQCRRG
jgi:hypothetical protein